MRALRWEPVVATSLLAVLVVVGASLGPVGVEAIAVRASLLLTAASLAFAADDLVGVVLPASPSGPGRRLGARLGRAVPLVVGGGLFLDAMAGRLGVSAPPWHVLAALACTGLGAAVALERWTDLLSPGAAGAGAVVLVVVVGALLSLPAGIADLVSSPTTSGVAISLAAAAIGLVERGRR